ncbi:hypothetical protein UCREL1_2708 [Eutypa lata UCREL1]|uniref:Protein kinase domain-containing protein n=1 Tax=Eutypa lata (strain UCR-EL1) TaxID=1287681 RepID=M7TK01_EUTLA|nr:hypothetical protein UCREL1_2708 [Eutypa lata UCREL1]
MASAGPAGGGAAAAAAAADAAAALAAYNQLGANAQEIMTYFTQQHRFRFIRSLHSAGGGALLCDEFAPPAGNNQPQFLRKLVIKQPLTNFRDTDIAYEITILDQLRGSEHIAQIVTYVDVNAANRNANSALRRPYFVMQFSPGGTLRQWVGPAHTEDVLWSIFLCYNVVVDEFMPQDFEHSIAPLIKMIDFGEANIDPNAADAVRENIYNIGIIMLSLAAQYDFSQDVLQAFQRPVTAAMIRTGNRGPPPTRTVNSNASWAFLTNPDYSDDFRELVALCLAVNVLERPSLSSLLALCTAKIYGVSTRRSALSMLMFNAAV